MAVSGVELFNLCQVRASADRYDGRTIVVRGYFDSDGEVTVAFDRRCPEVGVDVQFSNSIDSHTREEVNEAILDRLFVGAVKSISATLTGTFRIDRRAGTVYRLEVDALDDVEIERNP